MSSFIKSSPYISFLNKDREKELFKVRAGDRIARSIIGRLIKQRDELLESITTDYRQTGIYEAHMRGIPAEEIAHYGDFSVEYVERCISYKEREDYSRRTGNAIIIQWPEE
ncbi:hypothetical protein [Klebsiella pneumoniae]|uniref:hypothetical protein n=1 Tax=Klebsiella pneumoniae TaxID=573 RepID=UPI000D1BF715|nr:hypothetical protein [Klebsiella pneumoniae]